MRESTLSLFRGQYGVTIGNFHHVVNVERRKKLLQIVDIWSFMLVYNQQISLADFADKLESYSDHWQSKQDAKYLKDTDRLYSREVESFD